MAKKREKLTESLSFMLSKTERQVLVKMADAEGRSPSGMIRRAIVEAAMARGMWPPKGEGDG